MTNTIAESKEMQIEIRRVIHAPNREDVIQHLKDMKALLEQGWRQKVSAGDDQGESVTPHNDNAQTFSLLGAGTRVMADRSRPEEREFSPSRQVLGEAILAQDAIARAIIKDLGEDGKQDPLCFDLAE